jgi:hypothetical protein
MKTYTSKCCLDCEEVFTPRSPTQKRCGECRIKVQRIRNRNWQEANREQFQASVRESCRKWRKNNPAAKRAADRRYRTKDLESVRSNQRRYENERYRTDPEYRLRRILRARVAKALEGSRAGSAVRDLGCTVQEFRRHLESKFLPSMTWDKRSEWHIDHIKPLASFDLTDREQFLEACHYSNMQPLWAFDNQSKGDR